MKNSLEHKRVYYDLEQDPRLGIWTDRELAAERGCHVTTVRDARVRVGKEPVDRMKLVLEFGLLYRVNQDDSVTAWLSGVGGIEETAGTLEEAERRLRQAAIKVIRTRVR